MTYIKVDTELLSQLKSSINASEEAIVQGVAQMAMFHAADMHSKIPEEIKGKVMVAIVPAGTNQMLVKYSLKQDMGREFVLPTRRTSTFVEASTLSDSTRPTKISKSGETGYFLQNMLLTGKAAIGTYAMSKIIESIPVVNEETIEYGISKIIDEVAQSFEERGVKISSVGSFGARMRAPSGGFFNPINQRFYPGGTFIAGEL